jgi:hypothetical protein
VIRRGALYAIVALAGLATAVPAMASTAPFRATFRENFGRAPADPICLDADACGTGAVDVYGPASEREIWGSPFHRIIALADGRGTLVLRGTDDVIRDCLPPGGSGPAPGQPRSFGNPFECAGYIEVESGTGVFAGATGRLLERIYSGGDAAVVTDQGTLTFP